jgi:hypothetical protein
MILERLSGVTIAKPRVAGVLQMVSQVCMSQLRRICIIRVRDVGTYT